VFKWTDNRWKPVSRADIFNLARKTVLKIQSEARHAAAEAEANDLRRWSLTSQSEAKIRSMINMACKHEDIQVRLGDFDKDRNRINCLNGIIDLTNGQLLGRTPKDYVSKIINVDYDHYAKAPLFKRLSGKSSVTTKNLSTGCSGLLATASPARQANRFSLRPLAPEPMGNQR
jgi:phage/plasmid-associated DNA primase